MCGGLLPFADNCGPVLSFLGSHSAVGRRYQFNFKANCSSRSLVAVGDGRIAADAIALPLPSKIFVFGAWKFGLLNRLNASTRNCSVERSWNKCQLRNSDES